MIPKKIHYCRFGGNPKSKRILKCIASWKKLLTDYEIIEWTEENFNVNANYFTKTMYENKKRAFVSDYARLEVLYKYGGIYLDTDMEIIKKIDDFLHNECFFGFEDTKTVSCGIIGTTKNGSFIKRCLDKYNHIDPYSDLVQISIPKIITSELEKDGLSTYGNQRIGTVNLYEVEYFYPYYGTDIYSSNCIKPSTYAIHHREGSRYNRNFFQKTMLFITKYSIFFTKKIGIYKPLSRFWRKHFLGKVQF